MLLAGVALLVGLAFILLIFLINLATSPPDSGEIDSEAYRSELRSALMGADELVGEKLIRQSDCAHCHISGDGSDAPLFDGIGDIAKTRRPPLDAAQYLYEAILYPAVHIVDGYPNAMPAYDGRLEQEDLGHMIAFLLAQTSNATG